MSSTITYHPPPGQPERPAPAAGVALEDVIAAYVQAREQGAPMDRAAWLACFPAQADELDTFISTYERMQALAPAPLGRGDRVGDYELVAELGRGGMGVVYRARQLGLDREVALKVIRAGQLATAAERQRFVREALAAARASHPGIVPVYAVGEHAGHAYFSMQLVTGGSLSEHLARLRARPLAHAVAIVRQVALAVQHAHERGILHRDLKPANILLDAEDRPHVADFGLAKYLGGDSLSTAQGAIVGTACYMSPEQAAGRVDEITVASDVYGLGAILYELATGQPPFRGAFVLETLALVRSAEPVAPRALDSRVDADLAAICSQCLEKDPQARYRSAAALADDLGRWLDGRPVTARRLGVLARAGRWCRRRPERAALVLAAAALAATLVLAGVRELGAARAAAAVARGRAAEIMAGAQYSARHVARTVRSRIDELSAPVAEAASSLELASLLATDDGAGLARFIDDLGRRFGTDAGYHNWFVLNAQGRIQARWRGLSDELARADLSRRDYFAHAWRGIDAPYVSRVYESFSDDLYKFGMAAEVWHEGEMVGVLVASVATGPTLDTPALHDHTHTTAVIARIDPTSDLGAGEQRIIVHPAYRAGETAVAVDAPMAERLAGAPSGGIARYQDPVGAVHSSYRATWIAGFARVPDTPFTVLVQRRYDDELHEAQQYLAAARRRWYTALALALMAGLGGMLLVRRRMPARPA